MEGTATPVNRMKVSRKGFELMQTLLEKLEYDT